MKLTIVFSLLIIGMALCAPSATDLPEGFKPLDKDSALIKTFLMTLRGDIGALARRDIPGFRRLKHYQILEAGIRNPSRHQHIWFAAISLQPRGSCRVFIEDNEIDQVKLGKDSKCFQ